MLLYVLILFFWSPSTGPLFSPTPYISPWYFRAIQIFYISSFLALTVGVIYSIFFVNRAFLNFYPDQRSPRRLAIISSLLFCFVGLARFFYFIKSDCDCDLFRAALGLLLFVAGILGICLALVLPPISRSLKLAAMRKKFCVGAQVFCDFSTARWNGSDNFWEEDGRDASRVAAVVKEVRLDGILVETDAPLRILSETRTLFRMLPQDLQFN